MSKILMLWPDIRQPIPSTILKNTNVPELTLANLYKNASFAQRILRKTISICGGSTLGFCDSWIDDIHKYDIIIIHINVINYTVPHYLRRLGYRGRIISWYWNPVKASVNPSKLNRSETEIWSFSKYDCFEYNLQYNTTYSFFDEKSVDSVPSATVFFIGLDKGRFMEIQKIQSFLNSNGISTQFILVADSTSKEDKKHYSKPLPYDEVLRRTRGAKVLLEILQKNQTGESLRTMEALQFGKKLITNNINIKSEPYYNPSQFYIIEGESDFDGLIDFINTPINNANKKDFRSYYSFENWLRRFE